MWSCLSWLVLLVGSWHRRTVEPPHLSRRWQHYFCTSRHPHSPTHTPLPLHPHSPQGKAQKGEEQVEEGQKGQEREEGQEKQAQKEAQKVWQGEREGGAFHPHRSCRSRRSPLTFLDRTRRFEVQSMGTSSSGRLQRLVETRSVISTANPCCSFSTLPMNKHAPPTTVSNTTPHDARHTTTVTCVPTSVPRCSHP
jgi:hypothetical protein